MRFVFAGDFNGEPVDDSQDNLEADNYEEQLSQQPEVCIMSSLNNTKIETY